MVLVKMLMKIALPKMGELLVMTAVTISPSRGKYPRQNSSVGALDWFPPRFRLEMAASGPESLLLIFFLGQNASYRRRWAPRAHRLALEEGGRTLGRGRTPTLEAS